MNEQEQELINEFLKTNTVTKCPDAYECKIEHEFNITASPKHKQRKKREELVGSEKNSKYLEENFK